jgi:HSP20 family protein
MAWDWWNERRRRLGSSPFDNLFDEFEKMDAMLDKMWKDMMAGSTTQNPIFYGFRITTGPDGKPRFEEFGNMKPGLRGPEISERVEPIVDVVEEKDEIVVVADMPGVEKDEIRLSGIEDMLTIDVDAERRKYHKEVRLPAKVDPDSAKASYKNGVLEVRLKKTGKTQGHGIRIE